MSDSSQLRVPAVPLVTHTPFFSAWSMANRLTDDWSKHWAEENNPIGGLIRIDGRAFRFAGRDQFGIPAMEQVSLSVSATASTYRFHAGGIELTVEFLSPLLMDDLALMMRPVTYLSLTAKSIDGRSHEVGAYIDVTGEWCTRANGDLVYGGRHRVSGIWTLSMRAADQPVLKRVGDRVKIDWGTLVLATPKHPSTETVVGAQDGTRRGFVATGELPLSDDLRFPRRANDDNPVLAVSLPMGLVGEEPVERYAMLAYDEQFAVEYLGRRMPAYWRKDGMQLDELLTLAATEREDIQARCRAFDAKFAEDLRERGGEELVLLGNLAYRQCLAAHTVVEDVDGTLMMFSKENDSNGCIGTVDVTYPGSPLFFWLAPRLLKAQLEPVLQYAATPRWRFPFAPHDLGTYPLANGQVYGGGERTEENQMPVEECGNMLILVSAVCLRENDPSFALPYWSELTTWAEYLLASGLDPENQLCTDDFAGHLAHNANLSIKAIVALGAFGELGKLAGKPEAARFSDEAKEMAARWMELAGEPGNTRLAFDRPGTWSQKYNLVWDRLLGLGLFPEELARAEVAAYLGKMQPYGLPLDSRQTYTKLDWCVWTATMAERREDFDAMIRPLARFLAESPSRVPMTDWFDTVSGKQMAFQARSVVGGVFLPML